MADQNPKPAEQPKPPQPQPQGNPQTGTPNIPSQPKR